MTFPPDKSAYIRGHTWLAAVAMAGGMVVLWLLGNPFIWTGAVGGLAAVLLRGWYLMDEELTAIWTLGDKTLEGPGGRSVRLSEIETVRSLGSAVQVITRNGDKHLIKHQANPAATLAEIERAR